jgi:hypothetical protein
MMKLLVTHTFMFLWYLWANDEGKEDIEDKIYENKELENKKDEEECNIFVFLFLCNEKLLHIVFM